MSFQENLRNAFENIVPYITNLDVISSLIQQLTNDCNSLRDSVALLEKKKKNVDITLGTDIQILINEIQHILQLEKRKLVT